MTPRRGEGVAWRRRREGHRLAPEKGGGGEVGGVPAPPPSAKRGFSRVFTIRSETGHELRQSGTVAHKEVREKIPKEKPSTTAAEGCSLGFFGPKGYRDQLEKKTGGQTSQELKSTSKEDDKEKLQTRRKLSVCSILSCCEPQSRPPFPFGGGAQEEPSELGSQNKALVTPSLPAWGNLDS